MILSILFLISVIIFVFIFRRYIPVNGVFSLNWTDYDIEVEVIDVRDYNESYSSPIGDARNIPIAYLKRYYKEIPTKAVHLIASNSLEKNVGIRFFRKKGYQVMGFTIVDNKQNKINQNQYTIKTNF